MNVKELIEELKVLPPETMVLVQGYEDGFDLVAAVRKISAIKNIDPADWNGEYEASENSKEGNPAIVLLGKRR